MTLKGILDNFQALYPDNSYLIEYKLVLEGTEHQYRFTRASDYDTQIIAQMVWYAILARFARPKTEDYRRMVVCSNVVLLALLLSRVRVHVLYVRAQGYRYIITDYTAGSVLLHTKLWVNSQGVTAIGACRPK